MIRQLFVLFVTPLALFVGALPWIGAIKFSGGPVPTYLAGLLFALIAFGIEHAGRRIQFPGNAVPERALGYFGFTIACHIATALLVTALFPSVAVASYVRLFGVLVFYPPVRNYVSDRTSPSYSK